MLRSLLATVSPIAKAVGEVATDVSNSLLRRGRSISFEDEDARSDEGTCEPNDRGFVDESDEPA
jgi:hypothetical protein